MPSPYGGAGDNNKEMLTTLDINYRLPGRVAAVDDHAVRDPRDDQRYEKRGDDLDARVDLQRSLGDVGYAAVATTEADGVDVCPGEFTVDSRLLPPGTVLPRGESIRRRNHQHGHIHWRPADGEYRAVK